MNKIKDPNIEEQYNELKGMSLPDLCFKIAAQTEGSASYRLAKFVYEEKQAEEQFKGQMKLIDKQLIWIKIAAMLNVVAIISGVLLGWFLDTKTEQLQKVKQQIIELRQKPETPTTKPPVSPTSDPKKTEQKK